MNGLFKIKWAKIKWAKLSDIKLHNMRLLWLGFLVIKITQFLILTNKFHILARELIFGDI